LEEAVAKKETVLNRARDELFSHINRCGVLQAEDDDQQHWMDETIDYLAERYPDLTDAELQELYNVGMRFCQPAIPHGRKGQSASDEESETVSADEEAAEAEEGEEEGESELVSQGSGS
jgi:iron-sulfur cluster repair protein YtfE (RIC family)